MRKHLSIFTLLLSAAFAVGGAGVAFAERITAQYVSTRGTFSTEDTKSIDPYSADLGRERPAVESQVFTANPPAGHQVTTWLWKDDTDIRSEEDMSQVGSAQPTYTVTYSGKEGNRALGVRFDYIPFDVTFKGNGGNGSTASITNKNIDSSFTLTANGFKKTGYHFDHWANGLQKTFADQASVTGSNFWDTASAKFHADLKAQWAPNTYTVHFDGNGATGGSMEDESFSYDETRALTANAFEKTGFAFDGWATNATEGAVIYKDKVSVRNLTTNDNATVNLYARWTASGYTVTFDANGGGTPSPTTKTVTHGLTYGPLATCSRNGYSLDGWYTEKSGGTKITADTTVTITGAQTLYAHWTPDTYTITYDVKQGTASNPNPTTYTIESDDIVFQPPSEVPGYKFDKWAPASIPKGSTTGDKTVKASYLTITYRPSVHSPLTYNGYAQACFQTPLPTGVVAETPGEARVVGTYTTTFRPMSGYCWDDGTTEPYVVDWQIVNAEIVVNEIRQSGSLTYTGEPQQPQVYARATVKGGQTVTWKYSTSQGGYTETMPSFTDAGSYTVYFEASAPNHDPATGSFAVKIDRAKTAAVTVTPPSLRYTRKEQGPDVTVQHCSEEADSVKRATDVGTYKVKATPDVNYAWSNGETATREFEWSIVDSLYTVQFDGNGGAGEMASTNLAYNEEYIVPECAFTKTGCEFQRWQVLIDNKTVTNYLAGTVVSNLTTVAGKVVTFRAEWLGRYTIAFDANGGEGEMASTNVERDVGFQLPSNVFTRVGYDFTMWTTNLPPSEKSLVADGATVTNLVAAGETCTLHALWNAHRYTVIFDANGGTGSVPEGMEFIYDEAKELPSTPIPTEPLHYEFTGWGTNPKQATGTYQPGETVSNLTAVADGQVTLYAIWKFIPSTISAVLDCDNLYFENGEGTPWTVDEENYHFGGSSMTHLNERGEFTVRTESSGTLVFWWMGEYKYDPWDPRESRQTTLNLEYNDEKVSIDCTEDMTWQKKEIKILSASTVVFAHEGSVTCWVDHVTWTPDGGKPTPGEPVAVTAAGVTGGVFALTIPTESGVDYGVWTNADLTIDSWGLMGEPQEGKGNPLEFKWTILPEFPQLFFRAHKVEYK